MSNLISLSINVFRCLCLLNSHNYAHDLNYLQHIFGLWEIENCIQMQFFWKYKFETSIYFLCVLLRVFIFIIYMWSLTASQKSLKHLHLLLPTLLFRASAFAKTKKQNFNTIEKNGIKFNLLLAFTF